MADAPASVLAIVALRGGRIPGLAWPDLVMDLVATAVIAAWSVDLIRSAGAVLLDRVPSAGIEAEARQRLERDGDRVPDVHLWQIGPGHHAAVSSIVTDAPQPPATYKARLAGLPGLSHVTVEVERCGGHEA